MAYDWVRDISPWVRAVKIMKTTSLAGEWNDYDHVFTYIEQGEADFLLNGIKYSVREGDVILMHPFLQHVIVTTSPIPLIQYIFHFDLYYSEERSKWTVTGITHEKQKKIAAKEMRLTSLHPVAHLQHAERIEIKKKFLQLHKEFTDSKFLSSLVLKSIGTELLAIYLRKIEGAAEKEGKLTKGWALLEKAINHIHEAYSDPGLDIDRLSRHVGISYSHLSFLFRTQLGTTLYKYIMYIRIEQAKKQMMEGSETLTAIAEKVGFGSIHAFSRAFKEAAGMTASQFIAAHSHIPLTN
jgi:AraC-like DNA-binding protein